ncbi:hypothetical protein PFISCL1PPCAC_20269, partial [Pristionchus fissidentatus]
SPPSKKCKEDENEEKECVNKGSSVDDSKVLRIRVNPVTLEEVDDIVTDKKTIGGFPWILHCCTHWVVTGEPSFDCVEAFLNCDFKSKNTNWFGNYGAQFKLVNFEDDKKSIIVEREGRVDENTSDARAILMKVLEVAKPENGFIHGGEMTVEARVEMKRGRFVEPFNIDFSSPSTISDVILVVEGNKLHVSKQILSHHSSFFETVFYGNFKESKQSEININYVDIEDFTKLLNVVYGYEEAIRDNWTVVLRLADRFDMKKVMYQVEMHLVKDVVDSHYEQFSTMLLAERYNLGFLMDACMNSLITSGRIRRLMKNSAYGVLSDGIREELWKKLSELSIKEATDTGYQTRMSVKKAVAKVMDRPFDPDMDDLIDF